MAVALLVAIGEDQSKLPMGLVQLPTAVKLAPNPYCNCIDWALLLPPLRHCSPVKLMLRLVSAVPVSFVRDSASQPASAPLLGEPK